MWVKLCGLRSEADVDAAIAAGADALGFVVVPSARQVDAETVRRLVQRVAGRATTVAVFRQVYPAVLEQGAALGVDLVQGVLDGVPPGPDVLPVLADAVDLAERAMALGADSLLVDGPRFGSGTAPDWNRVAELARERAVILAGGLNPDNVRTAIARVRPMGVDVSSGIESRRGVKCPDRMHAFVQAARSAAFVQE